MASDVNLLFGGHLSSANGFIGVEISTSSATTKAFWNSSRTSLGFPDSDIHFNYDRLPMPKCSTTKNLRETLFCDCQQSTAVNWISPVFLLFFFIIYMCCDLTAARNCTSIAQTIFALLGKLVKTTGTRFAQMAEQILWFSSVINVDQI